LRAAYTLLLVCFARVTENMMRDSGTSFIVIKFIHSLAQMSMHLAFELIHVFRLCPLPRHINNLICSEMGKELPA
jgi:hypothetical protein